MQYPFPGDEWQRVMKELSELVKRIQPKIEIESFSRLSSSIPHIEPQALETIRESFARVCDVSASAITLEHCKTMADALTVSRLDPTIFAQCADTLKTLDAVSKPIRVPDYEKLLTSVYSTIRACSEYMTEEQAECAEKISPEILNPESPAGTTPNRLTLANLLALLSILVNLYCCILQRLPDEQLEELSAQNEIIIEQNDEAAHQRQQLAEQNEVLIEQNSKELELLQQLVDAQREIVELLEENDDLFVGCENSLVETDHTVLEIDDGIDAASELPETETDADSSDDQTDTDPE
ncbi:MAG: hypothetical protein Q4E45_02420 [Eubacteriales bacterium]|nr:hypothetical protein [Eubacteriales bacterium]